jgi:hypothetical protein
MKNIWEVILIAVIAVTLAYALLATQGCANSQQWQKTTVIDHLKKTETTVIMYKSDTGFDLGTEGLGEYNFIPVSLSGVGK